LDCRSKTFFVRFLAKDRVLDGGAGVTTGALSVYSPNNRWALSMALVSRTLTSGHARVRPCDVLKAIKRLHGKNYAELFGI